MDDGDEEAFGGIYENGHWIWNEKLNCLEYDNSAMRVQEEQAVMAITSKPPTGGTVHFRDDVDVVEQIRFRRRYQRKVRPGDPEVVTLQDIKDLAIYTAPLNILSPLLIDFLHQITTERFIRALILYCQYYLQVLEEMNFRKIESLTKIRTKASMIQEQTYANNLSDLRVLVAKEYAVMLMGGDDTMRFHHMGEQKKRKSLSNRDARLSETFLQMCMQIVWLALGRKSFNQLELEIHRMFKSDTFNVVEHNLKTGYVEKMNAIERAVLLGDCVRRDRKLQTRSPLSNEIFCGREIDFTMMGIGAISYPQNRSTAATAVFASRPRRLSKSCPPPNFKLTERVAYMANAISAPEDMLTMCGVTIGIIGMDRSRFDTMLRPLPAPAEKTSKSAVNFKRSSSIKKGGVSGVSLVEKIYPDIVLPPPNKTPVPFPPTFPQNTFSMPTCCFVQRNRWQKRFKKLMKGLKNQSQSR